MTLRLSRAQLAVPSAGEDLLVSDTLDREKAQEGGTCLFPALLLEPGYFTGLLSLRVGLLLEASYVLRL